MSGEEERMRCMSTNSMSRTSSVCSTTKNNPRLILEYQTELMIFEREIEAIGQTYTLSLIERRKDILNNDPIEEINQIYNDVKEMENAFQKILLIS